LAAVQACNERERAIERWLASGRYGRALIAERARLGAACGGASRLFDAKRKELGLDGSPPGSALRLQLSRLRALRAASRFDEARALVQSLLAANPGQAFVLAEAGLIEAASAKPEAAQPYFERAMLALGAPELEPPEARHRDFAHVAFGADSAELWSCNGGVRVTDVNTLEPLFRFPLAQGCGGLDVTRGALATTGGLLDLSSLTETRFGDGVRAVRFGGDQLLTVADSSGSGAPSFEARSASGERLGPALPLPAVGAGDLGVSGDPDGTWTVVSSTESAWAFDRATANAPLALDGPAVAVRGKRAVVNRRNHAELVELPSKRRLKRVPLEGCPQAGPPSTDISWVAVSRDASTVALLRCASITTWRWADEPPKALAGDSAEIRVPGGELEPFTLSADGSLLARAAASVLEVFDTRTGRKLRGVGPLPRRTLSVLAAPSGALALTTSERRTFVISESGKLEGELPNADGCRVEWFGSQAFRLQCEREPRVVSRAGGRTLATVPREPKAEPAAANAASGLAWRGNRGYRRSDGKHTVTIELSASGTAFIVTTASGFIEYLGAEPPTLPHCSFGTAQFPFSLCRDAALELGLLGQVMEHGEWLGR
jgi:hypothetical protein